MAGILKKFFHEKPSSTAEEDEFSVDYSFAIEYKGPAFDHEIPFAVPVSIDYIPTAATVVSSSQFNDLSSLPVIQPIIKKLERNSNSNSNSNSGLNGVVSSSLVITETDIGKDDNDNGGGDECVRKSFRGTVESLEIKDEDGFQVYISSSDSESEESALNSSSEIFSVKEEEEEVENETQPRHGRRPSAVTFLDPHSNSIVSEEEISYQFETERVQEVPRAERNGKKGSCYRCLKGNRLTAKELCVVCGAKYCCDCVIRAMGSMPEGRKCLTCIGFGIDESRRESLGQCSRMLKRLLIESVVTRIMILEKECEVNQLPPRLILVNGDPLCREELLLLQNCVNPPKNLKPGQYWYDKESGFWGKEGEGPCQVVSPQLEVGGRIKRNASNGNTNVFINSREITKKELMMLKMAGVPCEGQPSFWVSADGSCQEEGMKNTVKIWDKSKMKLVCAVLSLPVPSNSATSGEESVKKGSDNCVGRKVLHKFLLVGYNKSGTSTIFKQAKQIYEVPFSDDERQAIKFLIQRNLYWYLVILLDGRERFEEEEILLREKNKQPSNDPSNSSGNEDQVNNKTAYSIGPRLKGFADWLLEIVVSGNFDTIFPASTRVYAPLVQELWKDDAIQATYRRRNELEMLPRVATYFLDRAVDISSTDYDPSDNDILYAEGVSSCNSLSSMDFSFPESPRDAILDPPYQHDSSLRYQLIRVHPSSLGGNCKWLEMFEDTDVILFCVALTDYDEFSEDVNGVLVNRMVASKQLFESIITHPALKENNFLLLLNKFDLFEEKINQVSLNECEWFDDFNPMITQNSTGRSISNTNPSLAQRAFQYIAVKFKRLFSSLTEKKLFVSLTTGMEPENVNEALRYAREIMEWKIEKPNINNTESSCTSVEASSFT